MTTDPLQFRVLPFSLGGLATRHLIVDRTTYAPSILGSVYEAHLAAKSDSPYTRFNSLRSISELLTWARSAGVEIEVEFLSGSCLTSTQVGAFLEWLRTSILRCESSPLSVNARKHLNRTIYDARGLEAFCIRQYRASNLTVSESLVQLQGLINFQVALWADSTVKVRKKALAPDLLDKEIATIEAYLDPKVRCATVGPQIAARDYLIWRLTIEFGVRIGEVLALRIQDCPSRGKPYFQIVRIDERDSQFDPRHPYAPRPKTLSRELGFVLSNTRFPGLSLDYISQHRFKMIELRGRMIKKFNVGHDFLIVAQGGEPLSLSSTKRIAAEIRKHTGIDFHWHLARHAFFNRAMEGVRRARDRDDEIARRADLCFWGGWERESSLDIYTRRIRRDAMRQGLAIWQLGENTWGALN